MLRIATLRHPGVPASGPEPHRLAVRAIVRRGRDLLLVESRDGDLKLPGGRVEVGESEEDAVFTCTVQDRLGRQRLDDYEQDLGFMPVWLDVAVAVDRLRSRSAGSPSWARPELLVLERLAGEPA